MSSTATQSASWPDRRAWVHGSLIYVSSKFSRFFEDHLQESPIKLRTLNGRAIWPMRYLFLWTSVLVALAQPATSEPVSREQWQSLGKTWLQRPLRRQEMVSLCTAHFLARPALMKDIEEGYGMSGARAIAQFCADYYAAIGDGSLKYEDIYGDEASPDSKDDEDRRRQ